MRDIAGLKAEIIAKLAFCTYAKLEREYHVNRYYLWHIVNKSGYQPPAKVCAQLGIVRLEPAPVCAVHGVVHCYDCETQRPRPIRKPGKPRPRRAINLADPVSAAATILNHMPAENVRRLVDLLCWDVCAEPTATPKELHV